jgi:hypothetical protein
MNCQFQANAEDMESGINVTGGDNTRPLIQ